MRKAGDFVDDPEMFQTIWKHLKSDGVPDQAANQLTAEMMMLGDDIDTSIEAFERNYANFKEKGYCPEAAQALAVESLEKDADQPEESLRFARIYT